MGQKVPSDGKGVLYPPSFPSPDSILRRAVIAEHESAYITGKLVPGGLGERGRTKKSRWSKEEESRAAWEGDGGREERSPYPCMTALVIEWMIRGCRSGRVKRTGVKKGAE